MINLFAFEPTCFKIDARYIKNDFGASEGVIINIGNMFNNPKVNEYNITEAYAIVDLDTPRYIPYLSWAFMNCYQEENGVFTCGADDDGGHMSVKKQDDGIYFKIEGARLNETTDDPIIYIIEGKSDNFVKGEEKSCFQPSLNAIVKVKNFEENEKKSKLIDSLLALKDVVIYDVSYHQNIAIAVGEDNTLDTRLKSYKDEYHLGLILYSDDFGKHWNRIVEGSTPLHRVIVLDDKKAIVMGSIEGAGGVVKKTDDLKHWQTIYEGDFFNDIALHANEFFAVGHSIYHSKNGKDWKPIFKVKDEEFFAISSIGKHRLIATGMHGIFFSKDDGIHWQRATVDNDEYGLYMTYIYQKDDKVYIWARHPDGFKIVSDDDGEHWR